MKIKSNVVVILFVLVILTGCATTGTHHTVKNSREAATDILNRYIGKKVPGVQYIVVDKNHTIFEYSGGLADIKNQRRMKFSTTMPAYSLTKLITAAAVLQLVERDMVSLDDKMNQYLSSRPYSNDITIRHLLSHTSGIPHPFPIRMDIEHIMMWVCPIDNSERIDEDSALVQVLQEHKKLLFKPGKKYGYSNIGYWLLGKIIESVTNQRYIDYIKENLFKPLKLEEQELGFDIYDRANHAKGYLAKYSLSNFFKRVLIDKIAWCDYEGKWLHLRGCYMNGPSVAGLIGNARGFSRFLQDQLKDNSHLFNHETKELYYTQQQNNSGKLLNTTLGWHIGKLEGVEYFYRRGNGVGFYNEMRIYPTRGIATIIMTNKRISNANRIMRKLDKIFLKSTPLTTNINF
ncbi:penicillin binding protein/Beta-lactamase class C protein [Candidatus Scalindua japonica]|uniref:Penicillin binding protein/Beta-lactamase class C protein n=1 Tax=Candidatus Scalindua japonica TaxID=1284222 RepID=A0A286TVV2_9BACT|nr:serine hydrolase domain-containing protein [Candidatus Scalindua japonica]GAX60012.1 penicillin binding protein/Beta-lactamase class C protein [Candidatus Scalindua japonica]